MATFTTSYWETSIAQVRPDNVVIRGELVTDIMRGWGLVELGYFVMTGVRPTPGQIRVLEALMVSNVEHGISPSTTVARMLTSYGVPMQVGIAAGTLTCGEYHGGANEKAARLFKEVLDDIDAAGEERVHAITAAAASYVARFRAAQEPVEGFGHPQHSADPRVPVLVAIAKEQGVYGDACLFMEQVAAALERAVGRPVPPNIDGASAALLLDLGMDPRVARALLLTPRVMSLATHIVEEIHQGGKWRHVPNENVTYTGVGVDE